MKVKSEKQLIFDQWHNGEFPQFKTQKAICQHLGVSLVTGSAWNKKANKEHPERRAKVPVEFDIRQAFKENYEIIWNAFLKAVKEERISPTVFRTFAQLAGELVEKREDTVKVEFTVGDRQRLTASIITELREDARITGVCSICGVSQALCNKSLLLAEPKHPADREVEALEVSA